MPRSDEEDASRKAKETSSLRRGRKPRLEDDLNTTEPREIAQAKRKVAESSAREAETRERKFEHVVARNEYKRKNEIDRGATCR